MSVSVAVKNGAFTIGEGPHWDPTSKSLLYVDINAGDVHKWHSQTQEDTKIHFDKSVGFVVPSKSGGYVMGLGQTVAHFNWGSSEYKVLAEVDQGKNTRFNDAKCDPSGRLWCGTMGEESVPAQPERQQGSLYSIGKGQKIRTHLEKIDISNGLAWTADLKTMYYIDSLPRKVYAFDFDIAGGNISNQRVVVDVEKEPKDAWGFPDGMCIDNDGKIWVAFYGSGKVVKFDPQTGAELQTIKFPVSRTTSCCFGGENFDELYVTSAKFGSSDEEFQREPLAGSVFKVTAHGAKGAPAPLFED